MVMKRLGFRDKGFEENEEKIVEEDKFHSLFVEEEPSLEEIWETFNVFDENKDGFIDGLELGRVLCSLRFLKEGLDVERCKKMINCFDRNKDGLLDFIDFLEFMQISLR
ncbi:probable calcium-binding protein CML46 [Beta vulgaris subsp. vulgaris]|uniref:probable calcium-binding protein CML46 n=1 Tax=Beta vulgaris subsp. vulgaris TaxID=3555 RepID=UPI00053FAC69|nr:probable calcium-binding protein CML46 [Beta vulgaris subsp. vulgaris]